MPSGGLIGLGVGLTLFVLYFVFVRKPFDAVIDPSEVFSLRKIEFDLLISL